VPIQSPKDRQINGLTGLRAVAAFLVFLSHTNPQGAPAWLERFFGSGYCGVTLFFVLSGFVLGLRYRDTPNFFEVGFLRSFAVSRAARILPLYWLVLAWVSLPWIVQGDHGSTLLLHAFALQAWSPNISTVYVLNGPGWSVGVEIFLYAVFPFLAAALLLLRGSWRRLVSVLVITVCTMIAIATWTAISGREARPWTDPGSAHRILYRMPLSRIGDFLIGMTIAGLRGKIPKTLDDAFGKRALYVGSAIWLSLMLIPQHMFTGYSWDVSYAIPSAICIFGISIASGKGLLVRFLSSRQMVLLGEASYAFYLLHAPMVSGLGQKFPFGLPWLFSEILLCAIVSFAAIGIHLVFEKPAREFIRTQFLTRTNA
jgi:peptidoglycan/LPS O-acetylase OafA/YrhL